MLTPKRVKWRRQHRGRMRGKALVGNTLTFGEFGLSGVMRAAGVILAKRDPFMGPSGLPELAGPRRGREKLQGRDDEASLCA